MVDDEAPELLPRIHREEMDILGGLARYRFQPSQVGVELAPGDAAKGADLYTGQFARPDQVLDGADAAPERLRDLPRGEGERRRVVARPGGDGVGQIGVGFRASVSDPVILRRGEGTAIVAIPSVPRKG